MASKHVRSGRPLGRKVMHIITGLGAGGAEGVLYRLLAHQDREAWPSIVVSLTGGGVIADRIHALGVEVFSLEMSPGRVSLLAFFRLIHLIRSRKPDVVQTWMYHANLMGGLAARLAGIKHVIWGLRHTRLDPARDKRSTILVANLAGRLSTWIPVHIVCCSQSTYDSHLSYGYATDRMTVIPNGYDLERFKPDPDAAASLRVELGVDAETALIGMAARIHPLKDHPGFIQAARRLVDAGVDARFLLCGFGVTRENEALMGWIDSEGLLNHVYVLGVRKDMPCIYAGLDVATLASYGEGFPNVVAESMACGTLTVATDVGDVAEIIGDAGWVVPPGDPEALAEAWLAALALIPKARELLGMQARARIWSNFSIASMVSKYEVLYGIDHSAPSSLRYGSHTDSR